MTIRDLRLRIALSAVRTDLKVPALLGYALNEDEEMAAKGWLTEHGGSLDALIEAAQDFVRTERSQGVDVAAIAFLDDTAVVYPYLQTLLRIVPLLWELVLGKISGGQDPQLLENMRAIAAM